MPYWPGIEILTDDTGQGLHLQGNTDATLIGNVSDSLKTTITSVTPNTGVHVPAYLLNSTSADANVNGSSVNQVFTFTPAAGETWYAVGLACLLVDNGTMAPAVFGSLATALTNGILVEARSKGTLYTLMTLKNNMDLALLFSGAGAGNSSAAILGSIPDGFMDSKDYFQGTFGLSPAIILQNSTSDFIRITVRDNLTGADNLRFSVAKYRLT